MARSPFIAFILLDSDSTDVGSLDELPMMVGPMARAKLLMSILLTAELEATAFRWMMRWARVSWLGCGSREMAYTKIRKEIVFNL
jgi:hypothetical protein